MPELTYLKLMLDKTDAFDCLTDEQAGKLVKALLHYQKDGAVPDFSGMEMFAFTMFKTQMDADAAAYNQKCEANAENAKKGGRPKKQPVSSEEIEHTEKPNGFCEHDEKPNGFSENRTVSEKTEKTQVKSSQVKSRQDNIITPTPTACAREGFLTDQETDELAEGFNDVMDTARKVGFPETEYNHEAINSLLSQYSPEWMIIALNRCGSANAIDLRYLRKVLQAFKANGGPTPEHRPASKPKVKVVTEQQYTQRSYDDDENRLPKWMEQAIREQEEAAKSGAG